ncbi:MAG: DUF3459 domain-containing protein [Gracilibacteraceae bacterium]|jgi:maltose alpha-D-glucosyltransferase/alpha-amylase|nr:DUF3459 domain-containing protein [Gracilibacteraceae bacterium]
MEKHIIPQWLETAVFYQIYPQSFRDANGDGIGDLPGLTAQLDYVRELGANALWLNPCFESPFHDAGYDVSNFCKIAPRYGNNEDMRRLFTEAHKRGIHVLLDLVAGHTSVEHPWFRRSMRGEPGYAGRYIWADDVWERFEGIDGILGSINGFCQRGSCATNFYSTQPALNYGFARITQPWQTGPDSEDAAGTGEALREIMRFWLRLGCDGFRVDMAHSLVKADADKKETIRFWQKIRAFLEAEFPEAVLISEWGDPPRALAAGFHMDFLLHFGPTRYNDLFRENPYFSRRGAGDLSAFIRHYEKIRPPGGAGLVCIPSGNHDMPRLARHLDADELKIAFAFLLSMPGAPFIYYGDEIGMRYLEGLPSVEGGFERTGSRSPMQWDATLHAGFSSAAAEDLYIPLDPDPGRPTVAAQKADPDSLWQEVRHLLALRARHPALQNCAPVEFLPLPSAYPLVYRRGAGEEQILVALNPSGREAECALAGLGPAQPLLHSIGGAPVLGQNCLTMPPGSAAFILI